MTIGFGYSLSSSAVVSIPHIVPRSTNFKLVGAFLAHRLAVPYAPTLRTLPSSKATFGLYRLLRPLTATGTPYRMLGAYVECGFGFRLGWHIV